MALVCISIPFSKFLQTVIGLLCNLNSCLVVAFSLWKCTE